MKVGKLVLESIISLGSKSKWGHNVTHDVTKEIKELHDYR